MELAIFLIFAVLAVLSAVVVIAHRNPVFSVLSLVVTLFSLAVLFVLAGSPLLAALQVLVYTGAILVLFLFVIMLLNVGREAASPGHVVQKWVAIAGSVLLAAAVVLLYVSTHIAAHAVPLSKQFVDLVPLARELFTTDLLPFEIVGLLLLAAVVAATVLARRPSPEEESEESR